MCDLVACAGVFLTLLDGLDKREISIEIGQNDESYKLEITRLGFKEAEPRIEHNLTLFQTSCKESVTFIILLLHSNMISINFKKYLFRSC